LVEGDLGLGLLNLGEERHEGLDEVEEPYCMAKTMVSALSRTSMDNIVLAVAARAARVAQAPTATRARDAPRCNLQELMLGNWKGKPNIKSSRRKKEVAE
jgi:hypothetical protein